MLQFIRKLAKDNKGVAALEYSILAGLIVLAVATAATNSNITGSITTIFQNVGNDLQAVANN